MKDSSKSTSYLSIITSAIALFLLPDDSSPLYTVSVLIAGIGNYFWGSWIMSERIGSAKLASQALKSIVSVITLYAVVGIFVNLYHIVIWL